MRWSLYTYVMSSILLQEIELVEALCGFQKTIEMLDKRQLLVTSHPTEIIKPGKYPFNQNYGREIFFPGCGEIRAWASILVGPAPISRAKFLGKTLETVLSRKISEKIK